LIIKFEKWLKLGEGKLKLELKEMMTENLLGMILQQYIM
jgi:hypothetical protein